MNYVNDAEKKSEYGELGNIPDYEKAYHILMEHFDSLPDDVKEDVHEKLNELCL
tara:strand:- start:107 stop:268 length:162 start_codon:yes stop_codon:yes gene_type:complete